MSSTNIYTTFGNEVKYNLTQDTLVTYLDNATIKFPLPEASTDILSNIMSADDNINPQELDLLKTKLSSIGFSEPNAVAMASVLIKVAQSQGVSPMEYFEVNEASLKLTVDTYQTINLLRPAGNRIGLIQPINNGKSRVSRLIKP